MTTEDAQTTQAPETTAAPVETATSTTTAAPDQNLTPHQKFLSMLPEDLRTDPTFEPYKGESVEDIIGKLAKSHVNVNKLVGADKNAVLKFPTSPEDKEAYDAIYNKLGRPEAVDGYELDNYTKDNPLADADQLKQFAEMAHAEGVSKQAFDKMISWYYQTMGAQKEAFDTGLEKQIEEYTEQLKGEWGDAFDSKTTKIINTLKENATDDFKQLAADYPWVFDHPAVMKTIDNIIKMSAEDGAPSTAGTTGNAPMTPDEAKAAINAMDGDVEKMKILTTVGHPQRENLLKERERLFKFAYS